MQCGASVIDEAHLLTRPMLEEVRLLFSDRMDSDSLATLILTGQLFTDDAVTRIFEYTKGLPRRINQLCRTALMAGLIDQKSTLDESTIRKATPALRSGASVAYIDHD